MADEAGQLIMAEAQRQLANQEAALRAVLRDGLYWVCGLAPELAAAG
jgi:hypothetical protein